MFPSAAHRAFFVALLGTVLGCGDPGGDTVGSAEAGIVGGWAATADQIFATVEIRQAGAPGGFCSGALISPAIVVTAAHCAVVEPELGTVEPVASGKLWVAAGHLRSGAAQQEMIRVVTDVAIHDGYNHDFIMGRNRDGAGQGGIGSPNDIALLFLDAPYESIPVAPLLTPNRMTDLVQHGDVGFVAGYGVYDLDDGAKGELYISDAVIDIIGPRELLTRPTDRMGDSCFGDSGGPLYLPTDEGDFLVGVVSRGRSDVGRDCGDGGVYTLLPAHMTWIATNAHASFEPILGSGARDVSFLEAGTDALEVPAGGSLRRVRGCAAAPQGDGGGLLSALVLLAAAVALSRRLSRSWL